MSFITTLTGRAGGFRYGAGPGGGGGTGVYGNTISRLASGDSGLAGVTLDLEPYSYLKLPFEYDVTTQVVGTSGAITAEPGWGTHALYTDPGTIVNSATDPYGNNLVGVTKTISMTYGAAQQSAFYTLPYPIDPSAKVIKFAILGFAQQPNRGLQYMALSESGHGPAGVQSNGLQSFSYVALTNDPVSAYGYYNSESVETEMSAQSTGKDLDYRRYHWYRNEWNWNTNAVYVSAHRIDTNAVDASISATMTAGGQALGHVPAGLTDFGMWSVEGASTIRVARIWVGGQYDAWPTATLVV